MAVLRLLLREGVLVMVGVFRSWVFPSLLVFPSFSRNKHVSDAFITYVKKLVHNFIFEPFVPPLSYYGYNSAP